MAIKTNKKNEINLSGLNTSQAIRLCASKGMKTSEIYNYLKGKVTTKSGGEIRYQHVRNVLMTQLTTK